MRTANPKEVLVYFQEAGACFTAEMCDPKGGAYRATVDDGPPGTAGVFDFADERNPFSDYSVVWVTRPIGGEAVNDVHCRQCRVG